MGFDRPAINMLQDFLKTKDNTFIFPAHFVGKKIEYCHIENLLIWIRFPNLSALK